MTRSDPDTCARLLAAHGSSVRALARALVGAGPDADDVVQDAWLTAMERPPRHDRELRSWLLTIVRNVVRQGRRARTRRSTHEGGALAPPAIESPATLVERADLQRRIVAAVLALPDPIRATLLLRYFDDLGPGAIATRHGVPVNTVKTRLRRGLAQLRRSLDGGARGGRAVWLPVAVRIAGLPATVANTFFMSVQAKVVVAAVAVLFVVAAVGGTKLVLGSSDVPVEVDSRATGDGSLGPRGSGAVDAPRVAKPVDAPDRVAASNTVVLPGRLAGLRADLPFVTTVRLDVAFDPPGSEPRSTTLQAEVEGGGVFRFSAPLWLAEAAAAGAVPVVRLSVDDPNYIPAERVVSATELQAGLGGTPLALAVSCAGVLQGVVGQGSADHGTGAGRSDHPPVRVAAHAIGADGPETDPLATTDAAADGSYRLRFGARANVLLVAYVPDPENDAGGDRPAELGQWQPTSTQATAVPGSITDVLPMRLEPALAVTGRVAWPDGAPIEDAQVHAAIARPDARIQPPGGSLVWFADGRVARSDAWVKTDEGGRFELTGLSGVAMDLGTQWIGGDPVVVDDLRRTVTPPAEVEITIDAVRLRVAVTDGVRSLADATVKVRKGGLTFIAPARDGRRRVIVGRGREYVLVAEAPGHEPREVTWSATPSAVLQDLEIALTARPSHTVAVELDSCFEHARFELRPVDAGVDEVLRFDAVQMDGVFALEDVPAGRFQLTAARPGDRSHDNWLVEQTREILVPAVEPVRWPEVAEGGRILIRCRSHDGSFLAGGCEIRDVSDAVIATPLAVIKTGSSWFGGAGRLLPAGPNETSWNLRPGRYLVRVSPEGHDTREEWVTVEPRVVTPVDFKY